MKLERLAFKSPAAARLPAGSAATAAVISDAEPRSGGRGQVGLERVAFATLVVLALSFGLGDIASVTSLNAVLLTGVRGLLPLAIGLTLLATLLNGRLPAFPVRLALPAAAWLAVLVVSAALAPSNRPEALASLERPASGALLAWSVYNLCRTRARWRLLAQAAALGGLAIALVGLAEASGIPPARDWLAALHDGSIPIGDVPRIASTLSHPNEAAMLLELSLPLLVAWAWTASRRWRVPLALAALSNLVALVLTFSRAGVVSGMAGLAVMAGLCVVRGERRPLLSLSAAALAVPAALICAAITDQGLDRRLMAELSQPPALSIQHSVFSPQSSVPRPGSSLVNAQPTRLEFWTAALDMLRDHPWLGVGPDNFRWRFAGYSSIPADNLGVHAHDQYLEALADTGVLGLLTLVWLLLRLVRTALDGVRHGTPSADWPWRAAILASLSAWLLHALLDDFERFWPASVAFWLLAGLNLRLPDPRPTLSRVAGSAARPGGLRKPARKPATAAALSAGALLLTAACGQGGSPSSAYPTINGITCDTTEKVAFHIHAHLAILANGQPVTVPYGIGIGKPWQVQTEYGGTIRRERIMLLLAAHAHRGRSDPYRISSPAHLHPGRLLRHLGPAAKHQPGGDSAGQRDRLRKRRADQRRPERHRAPGPRARSARRGCRNARATVYLPTRTLSDLYDSEMDAGSHSDTPCWSSKDTQVRCRRRLVVKQPPHGGDHGDDHQQDEDAAG